MPERSIAPIFHPAHSVTGRFLMWLECMNCGGLVAPPDMPHPTIHPKIGRDAVIAGPCPHCGAKEGNDGSSD